MRLRPELLALLLVLAAGEASAQLLPTQSLPRLPGGLVDGSVQRTLDDPLSRAPLSALRGLRIDALLREAPRRVDRDPHGQPVLRGEFLLMEGDPATLAAVRAAGFDVAERDAGDALGLALHVLHDMRGRGATRAMRDLRRAAPHAAFAFQHLYLQAGMTARIAAPPERADAARARPIAAGEPVPLRVGMIDGAIDPRDSTLAGLRIERHGCDRPPTPDPHAVAIAARLAGHARGTLYAADLWCGDPVGQATLGLVDALAWMAREHVAVVNISLVGPDNPVLARAIAAMLARGHVLVAAVGNDGPAAPPLFPASYPGVIGVSGVDAKLRVLPEAASGPQVDFVASGLADRGRRALRGTSFASPVVARLAAMLPAPAAGAGSQMQAMLAARARDLGAPGRDPRYGEGLLDATP